jgi:S1-C subfamily serine protease
MYLEFRHLDGACTGQIRIVRKEFATIGRQPSADVPFDAERDLEVSGRHAAVFLQGDRWMVRDLGSTNGTWVNGVRIRGDHALLANDVIRFGAEGPQLLFLPHPGDVVPIPPTRRDEIRPVQEDSAVDALSPSAARPGPEHRGAGASPDDPILPKPPLLTPRHIKARLENRTPPEGSAPAAPPGPTTQKIRAEVARQTSGARRVAFGALGIALAAMAAVAVVLVSRNRAVARDRALLLARTDSLLARIVATSTTVDGLRAELATARSETQELRDSVAAEGGMTSQRLEALSRQLTASFERHQAALRAARFDAQAVAHLDNDAVGVVLSEFPNGRRVAGTGFAVRVRGDTGWILTCRHLVQDSTGRPPARLGMIFNGSNQNFRAELVLAADSADVALLSVRVSGGVPVVRGLGASPRAGEPVAVLGFPFGFDSPPGPDWQRDGVRATTFAGTILNVRSERLEVDSYGSAGSSGSPLLNSAGEVAGMVFAGERGTSGRVVYAVPARALTGIVAKAGIR